MNMGMLNRINIVVILTTSILIFERTPVSDATPQTGKSYNPLENLILNQNNHINVANSTEHALARVKRQFGNEYEPYGQRRRPIPVILGGGGFGGAGFGGRGYGGRGFGGRGIGGRGIGGRGIGGKGGIGGGRGRG